MNYHIKNTHISLIKAGDTVEHEGLIKTVSGVNIKKSQGVGITLFGDSYLLGYKPVKRVIIEVLKNV